jgi:pimeloyl-ACP methyl ester carboxylesterase
VTPRRPHSSSPVRQETDLPPGVRRELVPLTSEDGAALDAALYSAPSPPPTTALLFMHPSVSFLHHYALIPLARIGFATLGINSRYAGGDSTLVMERVVLDLAAGIELLRRRGFEKVVLVGNSGGGALACFYQGQAERATVRSTPAGDLPDLTRARLPRADALVLLNAHRGRAQVLTTWLDPAIVDEGDPLLTDAALDMFDPRNGPPYPEEFVQRYRAAQIVRNRRITEWARSGLEELGHAGASDAAFVVHRTTADLRFLDMGLDVSDRSPGTYWGPDVRAANLMPNGLARYSSLRSWLSQWGYDTTNAGAEENVANVTVPLLVVQGTADQGVFNSDVRAVFDAATVGDKELHWVRGGSHYFVHQPQLKSGVFDLIGGWLAKRGMLSIRD